MDDLPIDSSDASASMSFSDVNITETHIKTESLRHLEEAIGAGDNSAASLPTDEEIRAQVNPQRKHRRRVLLWLVAGSMMIIALVVGLSVGLVNRDEPRNAPSFEELVAFLSNNTISDYDDLMERGSPQFLAAKWLANDDGADLPLPDSQDERDTYLYVFRYVMAVNYFALNGPQWKYRMDFLTEKDICNWSGISETVEGVFAGFERGGVICRSGTNLPFALDLEYNELSGEIPTENGLLTSLQYLDLDFNDDLEGTIPTELCNLRDLKVFLLRGTMVEGELPGCISNWKNLAVLDVFLSEFSGQIPSALCSLTNLQLLGLDNNNDFQGSVPDCLGDLTDLRFLSLSNNQFTGEIPDLSPLADNLVDLYLDGNWFVGNPFPKINGLKNLRFLYLDENILEGDIVDLAKDMPLLQVLDLSFNQFTSVDGVPKHLFELPSLQVIDLSENMLQGDIPEDIAKNDVLFYLSLRQNQLAGSIPSTLKNLTALLHLDLSNNTFTGAMPSALFEMPSLIHIILSENANLQPGPLPLRLNSMQQLNVISLANTNRNGRLPELMNFTKLGILDFDNNGLTGTIPANYGLLPFLHILLLNNNPLNGVLPDFVSTSDLYILAVDGTDVSGDFSSVCSLPAFTTEKEKDATVIADCADEDSGIVCTCCHCCSEDDEMCRDHRWIGLDWMWERFGSNERENAYDLVDISF